MNDSRGSGLNVARAESARQRLVDDLREMTKVGENMIERSGRAGKNVLLGAGIIGLIGVVALVFRGRSARAALTLRGRRAPRSFLMEALRSVVLSTLGVLAARAAQRIPLPEPRSPATK